MKAKGVVILSFCYFTCSCGTIPGFVHAWDVLPKPLQLMLSRMCQLEEGAACRRLQIVQFALPLRCRCFARMSSATGSRSPALSLPSFCRDASSPTEITWALCPPEEQGPKIYSAGRKAAFFPLRFPWH